MFGDSLTSQTLSVLQRKSQYPACMPDAVEWLALQNRKGLACETSWGYKIRRWVLDTMFSFLAHYLVVVVVFELIVQTRVYSDWQKDNLWRGVPCKQKSPLGPDTYSWWAIPTTDTVSSSQTHLILKLSLWSCLLALLPSYRGLAEGLGMRLSQHVAGFRAVLIIKMDQTLHSELGLATQDQVYEVGDTIDRHIMYLWEVFADSGVCMRT